MSMKRQVEENAESPARLEALFEQIAVGGPRTPKEWLLVWHAVLEDRWLQGEVRRRAEILVRSHQLHRDGGDDISQQVFLYLAGKGATDPTLHFKPELLRGGFSAWIGTILGRASSEAARLIGEYRPLHVALREAGDLAREAPDWTCRADAAAAIEALPRRQRDVMLRFLEGLARNEISDQLGLSYKQVSYAIDQAVPKLRRLLAAYRREAL